MFSPIQEIILVRQRAKVNIFLEKKSLHLTKKAFLGCLQHQEHQKNDDAEGDPIPAKRLEIMLFDVAHQHSDHE